MRLMSLIALLALAGCASDPQTRAARIHAEMFQDCMAMTMPRFGPITVATAEQRRQAAETCKDVAR